MTLDVRGLSVSVPGRCLVRDLDVRFEAGENWVILGANGSGKSLLLHTLAGLRPATGQVTLQGDAIDALSAHERARRVALLLQEEIRSFAVTVLEAVLAARYAHLRAWQWETEQDAAAAEKALNQVGLPGFARRSLDNLSGGEQRRCAIAAVLAQEAPVSLWDEPTNHLDVRHQVAILELLARRALTHGVLNLFVLHDVNLAARFCSHALLLFGDGRYLHGAIGDVMTETNLSALYGCSIRRVGSAGSPVFSPA